MPHPISHAALRTAADQLLTVAAAGYTAQVSREYHERVAELPPHRRYEQCRDPIRALELDHLADVLATVTDAPAHQCRAAIREASGDLPQRDIGLRLLADLAREVRSLQAQTHRYSRTSGRRSA